MKQYEIKTCGPKCRSHKHAIEIINLMTKTNDAHILISALLQCWNCQKIQDNFGRNLLHMAASCGRREVCEWLIDMKKTDLNLKTFENGWTAAHCACFYGNIDSLIALIKRGANLTKNDYDHLTPIEGLNLDKWIATRYQADLNDDLDVYSWGSNENYNLGVGHELKKPNAEMVEFFKKTNITITQIEMGKFHSVFLSKTGEVFTCGFGIDGRLGHDNEQTLVSPKQVEALKNEKIIQVDASRNNTYFLSSEGVLYSCGTNEFKQLGQPSVNKILVPKPISGGKKLKGKPIKQFACSRFHVVVVTTSNEVYTFGLNAGQLGHPNETVANAISYNNTICYVSEPRLITHLNEPDIDISLVACSDGSTLCLQPSKNLLHIFNDYKPRRLYYMKEVGSPFTKLKVIGGKLDHSVNPDLKWIQDLANPITIVGLTEKNYLYIWREQENCWKNLTWSKNKSFKIIDFDLNNQGIIFCTNHGSCYRADFKNYKKMTSSPTSLKDDVKPSLPTETLDVFRIPLVNRGVRVFCDLKANNFTALQYHPNTTMHMYPMEMKSILRNDMKLFLDESLLNRDFYDIELKFRDRIFYVHKFILLTRCPKLFNKQDLIVKNRIDLDQNISAKFPNNAIEIIINFIYTNECPKEVIKKILKSCKILNETSFIKFINDFKETFIDKFGFSEFKACFDPSNYTKILRELHVNSKDSNDEKLEVMSDFLYKMFDFKIYKSNTKRKAFKFPRESYQEFYDCKIILNNEQSIDCHKCILIARSDFFRNMLLGSWLESNSAVISLPFDADLMQIFIDYLYSDEILLDFIHAGTNYTTSLKSKSEKEIEILFNLYVLSDQLLMERLKNLCEFKLANLVSLKNVAEIFEFSVEYDAKQLKDFCMEFMSLNLTTLIDSKQLENVNLNRLADLSSFYKKYFSVIESRMITPYSDGLDVDKIDLVPSDLIFDKNFVDGNLNEIEEQWSRSKKIIPNRSDNKKELENFESPKEEPNVQIEQNIEIEEENNKNDESLKWEKVKKKKTRKISTKENEPSKTPVGLNPYQKPSPPGAFFNQNDLNKFNEEKKRNENQKKQEKEEWPSLLNAIESKVDREIKLPKSKLNKESKACSVVLNTPKSPNEPKVKEENKLTWGTTPTPTSSSSTFSLMDIINEEMKKVNLNKKEVKIPEIVKSPIQTNKTEQPKGWNLNQNNFTEKSSFSQIIEMEQKSKEQYNKLKNRPLNSIQLEEKAIQDLKMLYQVDQITDITITIELIDEVDTKSCLAPIWKKN
ncbi:unnamed protein product [Brachionus calyciflorus]|uniref:BTB domain-containing protein n=1 Tax=Brachionus calyciflorus TaxID=104777 RepID=A0A813MI20_9BILA|nr:unnamed protein product [Brachionus calyciflorus]